jgi:hypothetical protein
MLRSVICPSLLLLAVTACASDQASRQEEAPWVDPRAAELMESVCARAAQAQDLRFTLVDSMDEVQPSGQKLQFGHRRRITLSRPSLLHVESTGDRAHRSIWKDGETITIADHDHEVFTTLDDPGTIDDMMDMLYYDYGIATPLADILSANPHEVFMKDVETASYVGLHEAGGEPCHHLAMQLPNLDYQVWISEADQRMKKMVITYWQLPGEPQYTLWIEDSSPPSSLPASAFAADVPDGYEQLDLEPLLAESAQ